MQADFHLTPVLCPAPCPSVVLQFPSVSCHVLTQCDSFFVTGHSERGDTATLCVPAPSLRECHFARPPSQYFPQALAQRIPSLSSPHCTGRCTLTAGSGRRWFFDPPLASGGVLSGLLVCAWCISHLASSTSSLQNIPPDLTDLSFLPSGKTALIVLRSRSVENDRREQHCPEESKFSCSSGDAETGQLSRVDFRITSPLSRSPKPPE